MNVKSLEKVVSLFIKNKIDKCALLIWGATGGGKTTICKQQARKHGLDFMAFSCETLTDPADLRGGIVNVADANGYVMQYSVPELIKKLEKTRTLMLFDELVRTPPQSQAALMSVFTEERRLGLHQLPEGTVIVAAANPVGDDYFGNELDMAQVERFLHVNYAPDRGEVLNYLEEKDTHPGILSFFAQVADAMYCPLLQSPYRPKAVPRAIEAFAQIQKAMTEDEFDDIGHEVAEGLVGEHAAGVIQAIKNAFEVSLKLEEMLEGTGIHRLKKWGGKSQKIALFNDSLRVLVGAVEKRDERWTKFEQDVRANVEVLEPFCASLALFPADLLRKNLLRMIDKAPGVFGVAVTQSKRAGNTFKGIADLVALSTNLRAQEEKLSATLQNRGK